MSNHCKNELLAWRARLGPEFSEYVFANPLRPEPHLVDIRVAWSKAVKAAGLDYFWIYDLRHTFASRITEAGASHIFVAQIMGHFSANILQTYVKAIDEFRRSAISKLEALREAAVPAMPAILASSCERWHGRARFSLIPFELFLSSLRPIPVSG
jgi:integrase